MGFLQGLSGLPWFVPLAAFLQIALIDVTLAADNAVAVGMAASGLAPRQRRLAMLLGLSGAVVLLCVLAVFAIGLLKAGGGGLLVGGGVLLLLVGRQMWRDLRQQEARAHHRDKPSEPKTLLKALTLIFLADMSTSLDNVLAVAGVARNQPNWVLFAGLALSVALTGFAAVAVGRLLQRWPWIGYIGLLIVLYVAARMVFDGAEELKWIKL
jgi:YjbE family integral membrane protein